ncbi:ARM repeat superfamily protein [Abeliophyllum distichum]|uniref:ARM repeat superfamily protein n=1 Tax=Abeliophyllum distichum TaxID=126358 RepID=A0ABD1VAS2_9LAMI
MKAHINMVKGKGNIRVNNQQVIFELKKRVVLALNKLADRDTYQIGVEELEETIECLTAEGVAPFLSCILDTDSKQKSMVRKECVRLLGVFATFHEGLTGTYLGKMVASIVKRLKDSDSVVRDACVETVGILASKLNGSVGENDGVFVVLVRPLFEALGEQNKQVQFGSALCLSRVIDNIHNPPASILQKMLARTVKLLKNPHFMAKPAIIELNRSIIQAGGAATRSAFSAAMTSIQEALKNSDWATRKAASSALGDIASCGGACLGSFRSSCIRCLESCRFDKVKPVRDTALQALHLWRNLPGSDTPEPSEAGSSVKETAYRDDYGDVTSTGDSMLKDVTLKKFSGDLSKRRVLSLRNTVRNHVEKPQNSETNDWQIQIAVPKSQTISVADIQNEESEGSSVTKRCEMTNADTRSNKDNGYGDDKQDSFSVSDLFSESIKSKIVTAHCDVLDDVSLVKSTGTSKREEVSIEERRYVANICDRRSLDSTVTESSSHVMHGCCSQTEKELVLIRKQLLEIESKQSNLMDLLKVFTNNIMDSMSAVQSKVSSLEQVVDKMAQEILHGGRYSDALATKLLKRSPGVASPRLSTCTPRSSVDIRNRQPALLQTKNAEVWEDKTCTRTRSSNLIKQGMDIWTDTTPKLSKHSVGKGTPTSSGPKIHCDQTRSDNVFAPVLHNARLNKLETKNSLWNVVKTYLSGGDLDLAYIEAIRSCNELVLFELLDRTGPVLENLSQKTTSDLLGILASYFLEQRFVNSIIPWLQQLVDLASIHGSSYVMVSAKTRRDFLSAIQEAVKEDVYDPAERRFLSELGKTLHQIWGNGCI